jgi:hypothetical protein
MTKDKFYNDTFNFDLTLIIFDSESKKEVKAVANVLESFDCDRSDIIEYIEHSNAFVCGSQSDLYIMIECNRFDNKKKNGIIHAIKVLQHECNHVRQNVLEFISERVTQTDTECYLRISDWAFKKCMNTKYFKSMLK